MKKILEYRVYTYADDKIMGTYYGDYMKVDNGYATIYKNIYINNMFISAIVAAFNLNHVYVISDEACSN